MIIFVELIVGFALMLYFGAIGTTRMDIANETITVEGQGKVYVTPDIAVARMGVTTESEKSEEAVSKNNEKMNNIIKEIKAMGIEDKDIETVNYSLYPKYDYSGGRDTIIGYTLSQEINIKVRDFNQVSAVIQKATSLGANTINQLTFSVDNPEKAKNEAMQLAIEKAKEKAEVMAKASGLRLGKLVNVYEGGSGGGTIPLYAEKSMGMGGGDSSPAPDIQAGQQEIVVNMSLVYRLR